MDIYTAQQAAAALGCHLNTIKTHAARLRLGKLSRIWAITRADLSRLRDSLEEAAENRSSGGAETKRKNSRKKSK